MFVDCLEGYIETVAGHVNDNDKVVTYKWLSKELEVHVNLAKQILWEFSKRHQEQGDITSTYLLMGTLNDGGMHVEVVKDVDLELSKKKYKEIIAQHIYSLQKSLPDIELLAISGEGDVRFSAIECNESTERTDEEMHVLRWGATAGSKIPMSQDQKTESIHDPQTVEKSCPQIDTVKSTSSNKTSSSAQKKGFNNLFGKAAAKQKSSGEKSDISSTKPTSNEKQISPKQSTSKSPKTKSEKGSINSFFGQQKNGETNKNKPLAVENTANNSITPEETSTKHVTAIKDKRTKEIRGKKRTRSKENSSTASKRKRIMIQSDSSESEMSQDDEHEAEVEMSPSPQRVSPPKDRTPSPPRVKQEGGKRKVLKLVDKTFEEDGFLVTKKVHVYESCSDEEPEKVEVKKSTSPESRPETKGKKNIKQTTLMNFFKKS